MLTRCLHAAFAFAVCHAAAATTLRHAAAIATAMPVVTVSSHVATDVTRRCFAAIMRYAIRCCHAAAATLMLTKAPALCHAADAMPRRCQIITMLR